MPARRAPDGPLLAPARDRAQPALDGADAGVGARGRGARAQRRRRLAACWKCETLAGAAAGSPLTVGYPEPASRAACSAPSEPACVAQDDLEPLLLAHLRGQPSARVELGTELTGVWAGPDGARAELRDVRTGAVRTVHARYVVAADGARSAVRSALGIAMRGAEGGARRASRRCSARRCGTSSGPHRHLLYSVTRAEAPGDVPARRPVGPLAARAQRGARRPTSAGPRSSSGSARACPTCRCGSSGRGASPPRRSSPSASAAARSSSPATPRTA